MSIDYKHKLSTEELAWLQKHEKQLKPKQKKSKSKKRKKRKLKRKIKLLFGYNTVSN